MKCSIKSIRNLALKGNRSGSRVEGFVTLDSTLIPDSILKWLAEYKGVKTVVYENGISVAAWGETKCDDRDTFDPVKGSHIAESKAKAKLYRFMKNFSYEMYSYYDSIANYFDEAQVKYDHCLDHEEAHTAFLVEDNE